jgi:HprK-related kinase A
MIVRELALRQFRVRLAESGLTVRLGPFNVRIQTRLRELADQLYFLYTNHALVEDEITEIHLQIVARRFLRQPFSPAAQCLLDGQDLLPAVPAGEALDLLERCIRFAVVDRTNHLLIFRAAALERNGHVLLLPSRTHSTTETLCAALIHRGYRLLSDRLGMLDPGSGEFVPIPTALSFGSDSIRVIREHFPDVATESSVIESCGGATLHVGPPIESVDRAADTARARWIVFPEWSANDTSQLERVNESGAFFRLAGSAYNYEMLGAEGFAAVAQLVATCRSYSLDCSDFENALTVLEELTDGN